MFFVEAIDDDDLGDAVLGGVFPDLVGANADAVDGIDDDEGEVRDSERAETFADEIEVTRGIDDIELLVQPFGMEEGGVDGDFAVLFVGVIIGEGGAGGDAAEAVDDAGASQHAFTQHGLAGGGMADDRKVPDVFGMIRFHRWSNACMWCGGHASKQKHLKRPVTCFSVLTEGNTGSKDLGKEESTLLQCERHWLMNFRFFSLLGLVAGLAGFALSFSTLTILAAGAEWVEQPSGTADSLNDVVFGRGRFVAVGEQDTVLSSTDGVTWRPEDAGEGHWYFGVGFGNNTFVAVGTDGLVTTSPDAEQWVARESGTTNWLYDVAWGEAGFVAVGYAGAIVSSSDGVTWTNRASGTDSWLHGVAASTNIYVAVGTGGTILSSTNAMDWAAQESGTNRWLFDVVYGQGQFVAVGEWGTVVTSTNGQDWVLRSTARSDYLWAVGTNEFGFLAAGQGGLILTSSDGVTWVASRPACRAGSTGLPPEWRRRWW